MAGSGDRKNRKDGSLYATERAWERIGKSCMNLVFGTMIRISDKWREISMSEYDLALLRNIRSLMGWINSKESNENQFISKKYAA